MINELESREIITSTITLYGAILFLQEEELGLFNTFAFLIIVLINIFYLTLWVYCYIRALEHKIPMLREVANSMQRYLFISNDVYIDEKHFSKT